MHQSPIGRGSRLHQAFRSFLQAKPFSQLLPKVSFTPACVVMHKFRLNLVAVFTQNQDHTKLMQGFAVDQGSVKVKQYSFHRMWTGRGGNGGHLFTTWCVRALLLLLIVPCSGACASVDVDNSNTLVEAAALNLEIPPRYEHWRDSIEEQLVIAHQEFVGMNRWLRSSDSNQVSTLVLCLDVLAANKLYGQLSLSGNPQVARSFAKQKLAVVPLPRNDGLLAARARPPITLMRSPISLPPPTPPAHAARLLGWHPLRLRVRLERLARGCHRSDANP